MTWIKVLFWLIPRRVISSWLLLSVVSFGILAAVTLMAVGVLYSKALAEGGIRHTLASVPQTSINAQIAVQKRPLGPADYQRLRGVVEDIVDDRLGYMVRNTQRSGRSQSNLPLVLNLDGRAPSVLSPWGQPFFLTDFEKHATIVEGRWPHGEPVFYDNGVSVEMVVGRQTASVMGWDVGEQVYLIPFAGDPSQSVSLTLVGLVEPIDPEEEYWMASATYYFNAQEFDPIVLAPVYLTENAFFGGLGTKFPSLLGDYWWYLFLDTGVITADIAGQTKENLLDLENDLSRSVTRFVVFSLLERTIEDYQRELSLAKTSIFLFLSLVVVVILYFLVLVLELLSRTQSDAANILRSRGANMLQVGGFFVLGESCIVLISTVLGPFLAVGIVRYLLLRTITAVEGSTHLPVELSLDVFLVGAIGGLLSLVVLSVSGISIARLGTVEFLRRRVRPPTVPILHRYYVDILVLAAGSLIWWQIEERGGFTQRDLNSNRLMEVDFSMLLGPALVLLATAFLILRLLPLLVTFLAWIGGFVAPAWVSFALMRIARDPLPHGSLVVMMTMATALGMFGATFQSTISRSQEEQILYRIGGDLVIEGSDLSDSIQEELESLPGVLAASPVVRISSTLLGVDPYSLHNVAWFRNDFADKSLSELLTPLVQEKQGYPGIVLPYDTESIGLWLRLDNTDQTSTSRTFFIRVRITGSSGIYRTISLGELSSVVPNQGVSSDHEWVYFEAPLPEVLKPPFSVVSIFINAPFGSSLGLQPGSISIDDVTVNGPSMFPDGLVVEDYEESASSSTWVTLPTLDSNTDHLELRTEAARSGQFGLTFSWMNALGDSPRGILAPSGPIPLPAVGGSSFDLGQEVRVESENRPVPLVVRSVTEYFPSIIQPDRPFLLINYEDYKNYMNRMPGYGATDPPKQFWVSLNHKFSHSGTVRLIKSRIPDVSVQDREVAVELAQSNPLLGSSWTGLTILSMFALTIAVAITLSTYSVVSIQMDRMDLTIAGALGFSRMELFLAVALEKILVAILGMGIGSAVGIWLSQWVLNFLDGTIGSTTSVPPTIFTIDNGLITLVYISLILSSSIAILAAAISARRLNAPDILRSG